MHLLHSALSARLPSIFIGRAASSVQEQCSESGPQHIRVHVILKDDGDLAARINRTEQASLTNNTMPIPALFPRELGRRCHRLTTVFAAFCFAAQLPLRVPLGMCWYVARKWPEKLARLSETWGIQGWREMQNFSSPRCRHSMQPHPRRPSSPQKLRLVSQCAKKAVVYRSSVCGFGYRISEGFGCGFIFSAVGRDSWRSPTDN